MACLSTLAACTPLEQMIGGEPSPTPWIVYVTATPPGEVAAVDASPAPSQQPIGPFGAGAAPPLEFPATVPPIDLSGVTAVPTADGAPTLAPGVTPSMTAPATVTTLPGTPTATLPPSSTATPTATLPPAPSATSVPPQLAAPGDVSFAPNLGLNFISSAQHEADGARFAAGIGTGVGWDRFAIYWSDIEQTRDQYVWGLYDRTVQQDIDNGLSTNAILLGTPGIYYGQGGVPFGLYEPVFSDGTDTPGGSKTINPNNPWAEFVYAAVNRYKPGGQLARVSRWPSGKGIRVWEIWNEPDFSAFWGGSVSDYARLLKVAYLAARQADSGARIMVGGLVVWEKQGWFVDLLNIYKNDPNPVAARYPFDMLAIHSYSHPPNTFEIVARHKSLLAIYGLSGVPIWLNETGVPVWNDYPGPSWATRPDQIVWRATLDEQAAYVIQNAAYAFMAGAEAVFHFQLYDDCGNQPRGTSFAPHDGSLCNSGAACWGDALGLMRNTRQNVCFNQHPNPGTPRPAYNALKVVSNVFGGQQAVPITAQRTGPGGKQIVLVFARPNTREVISVVWDTGGQPGQVVLNARADRALLYDRTGAVQEITPNDQGQYLLSLDPATNRNGVGISGYMIGGSPVILVEAVAGSLVSIVPLPDVSRQAALVRWRSSNPAVNLYEVWYRDDTSLGGEWVRWFEATSPGEALFVGGVGRTYSFFARGRLPDGTWTDTGPYPQARTQLAG